LSFYRRLPEPFTSSPLSLSLAINFRVFSLSLGHNLLVSPFLPADFLLKSIFALWREETAPSESALVVSVFPIHDFFRVRRVEKRVWLIASFLKGADSVARDGG